MEAQDYSVAEQADGQVQVVSCITCQGPVPSNIPRCLTCGAPRTGAEVAYVASTPAAPDIGRMVKWWAILSAGIFALGGFSFGIGSTIAFSVVSVVFAIRILRAVYL